MIRTRIKICGITRPEDAVEAARLGADAIGLVFYADSPRLVSIAQAQAIVAELPAFVTAVGLFVDAPEAQVAEVLAQLPLDLLQFHGQETADYCQRFTKPYIKAVRMRPDVDLNAEAKHHAMARALLLDSFQPGVPGGTGQTFDWLSVPAELKKPIILAGGLTPTNVGAAVAALHPFAVDVSGGVETAKGIKDATKMAAFINQVRGADADAGD